MAAVKSKLQSALRGVLVPTSNTIWSVSCGITELKSEVNPFFVWSPFYKSFGAYFDGGETVTPNSSRNSGGIGAGNVMSHVVDMDTG